MLHSIALIEINRGIRRRGIRLATGGQAPDSALDSRHGLERRMPAATTILTFLGAAGTVTGSKYLLQSQGLRLLVDCGLFQGYKQLRLRNWASLPINPRDIAAVVLTHAHLDHSGYLPLLVKNGFSGRVYCTEATHDLCGILLPDSGHLQEKDAVFANRHGFSKHSPALPLYTQSDAERALTLFSPVAFEREFALPGGFTGRFLTAGHILGAAITELRHDDKTIVFSGDLGRPDSLLLHDPAKVERADYLVVESTYGDRMHDRRDPAEALSEVIRRTAARGGTIVIPSFAVGRAQEVLVHLWRARQAKRIPELPIFLDSPMAIDASDIFCDHGAEHRMRREDVARAFSIARYVHTQEESKALDAAGHIPKVIISASGMATGGRVLHHLKAYAPDPRNTILFVGFQAGGTRGADMVGGAESVKIHGEFVPVRAEVVAVHSLSAHADAGEIMGWLANFRTPPRRTFITHGEPGASDALRKRIEQELGWRCLVPAYRDEVVLA
jgi:metallo-beta-lactamase family protein